MAPTAKGRRRVVFALVALAAGGGLWAAAFVRPFPADTAPEGAYLRIAMNVSKDRVREVFAYLETDAQWASFTLRDMRAKACARVRASYPEAERASLLAAWEPEANAPDGADVFARHATRRGWVARLRKDLSGVARVEVEGPRATVVTVRGTRYPFRRRDNGIWGLTLFTADLVAESERAARDLAMVTAAADDYDRARARP